MPSQARALTALLALTTPAALPAQGAVSVHAVVSEAALLRSEGKREAARRTLSDYLAHRPEDATAWLELGRAYHADARAWFLGGRRGEAHGVLLLDFAATALEQALRLGADSAALTRQLVEMDRAAVVFGEFGPEQLAELRPAPDLAPLGPWVVELGRNLAAGCPAHAVVIPGTDLEALALWHATFVARERPDLLVLRPDWYLNDGVYRRRMAVALDVDRGEALRKALERVAERRRVCLTPFADVSALPRLDWTANGLVRVTGAVAEAAPAPEVTALRAVEPATAGVREVREVYAAAAATAPVLCRPLAGALGSSAPAACRRR